MFNCEYHLVLFNEYSYFEGNFKVNLRPPVVEIETWGISFKGPPPLQPERVNLLLLVSDFVTLRR